MKEGKRKALQELTCVTPRRQFIAGWLQDRRGMNSSENWERPCQLQIRDSHLAQSKPGLLNKILSTGLGNSLLDAATATCSCNRAATEETVTAAYCRRQQAHFSGENCPSTPSTAQRPVRSALCRSILVKSVRQTSAKSWATLRVGLRRLSCELPWRGPCFSSGWFWEAHCNSCVSSHTRKSQRIGAWTGLEVCPNRPSAPEVSSTE